MLIDEKTLPSMSQPKSSTQTDLNSSTEFNTEKGRDSQRQRIRKERDLGWTDKLIISQDSIFTQILNLIITLFSLWSTISACYYACFGSPKTNYMQITEYVVESFFLLDIITTFFLEYQDNEDRVPVRSHKKIATRYLKRRFFLDIIALGVLPANLFLRGAIKEKYLTLTYLLRMLRLARAVIVIEIQGFQKVLKKIYWNKMLKTLKKMDHLHTEIDVSVDNNKIMTQIMVMYAFQVFRLIVFILSLSYFVGAIWFICTKHFTDLDQLARFRVQEAQMRFLQGETEEPPAPVDDMAEVDIDEPVEKPFTFYAQFDLDQNKDETNLILVMYFAFTTLSTVGFGDYHPKSEIERVINTFILLVGVTAFSYIMGQFIEILIDLRTVTASNENSQQLAEWFGMLAHFNKNRPLPKQMIAELETYFEYFWQNDRNYAIKSEEDQRFMDELPNNIQTDIYKDFLF